MISRRSWRRLGASIFCLCTGLLLTATQARADLLINEVDADQVGTDSAEFVELYNTGPGTVDFSTSPHVLVFFNGDSTGDASYLAVDLVGSVAANDYYVVGSTPVANLDLDACGSPNCTNLIQNGTDAVALYTGTSASFSNGEGPTMTGLVDALVYDTSDADDTALLSVLTPGQPQINENGNGMKDTESMQRCPDGAGGALVTTSYGLGAPTPGTANSCGPATGACIFADTSCIETDEADCMTQGGTYQGDDTFCPSGACILPDNSCDVLEPFDCTAASGNYLGDGTTCTSGACILMDSSCIETHPAVCSSMSGTYQGDGTNCPSGACILPNTTCIITYEVDCTNQGGTYQGDNTMCPTPTSTMLINEVDADQAGTDTAEFVELYNAGASTIDFSTSPHVLVFYNGNGDTSYMAVDLTGSVAPGDYYVAGITGVANLDLDICSMPGCTSVIQNGADAVALYANTAAQFPNGTAVTSTSLIDAVVYGTSDSDDPELLAALTPGQPQVDEGAVDSAIESIQRCPDGAGGALNTGSYTTATPTPGTSNCQPFGACVLMDMSCISTTEADCMAQSGTYQGDNTTCPTGACVLPDTTCSITTDEDCGSMGGTYQGDDTVCPTGACIVGGACTVVEPSACTDLGGTYQGDGTMCPAVTSTLLINEVDADQASTDMDEFVELYNAGGTTIDFATSPHVLVFYNGSGDDSYFAIDLTGSVAPGDYYVVGSSTVANLDLDLCDPVGGGCTDALQNGPDAVALYEGTTAVFPDGTPVTDASLVDAIVYDTGDPDATGLLDVLTPGQPQVDEDANANSEDVSMQRCPDGNGGPRNTSAYVLRAPTPGTGTICSGACCLPNNTCQFTDEVSCNMAGGAYKGDGSSCATPGLCDCVSIEDIKLFGEAGTGYILCDVTVVETVNQGGPLFNDRSFTVQDQSGVDASGPGGTERGFRIVGDVVAHPDLVPVMDALAEGDVVRIVGTLEDDAGLGYLRVSQASNIMETGTGGVFNVPTITAADLAPGSLTAENLESIRVNVTCVAFQNGGGTFAAFSNNTTTDGFASFNTRINNDDNATSPVVGTAIPSDAVDLVGVVAQFFDPELYLHETDDILAPNCGGQLGACCLFDGSCIQVTSAMCADMGINGTFQGVGVGCDPSPCVVVTGACCVDGVCTEDVEITACCGMGGIFLGQDSTCAAGCPDFSSIRINEIRIDQTGADDDEYFELKGIPGTPLDHLTYIVIGDAPSGTIEAVVPLDGYQIQPDGFFLVTEATFGTTFPGATPDLITNLNFENSDNVTHMLVASFNGSDGDNVDADGDCVIDASPPWCQIIDSVALVETPASGDCYYGSATVGPDGSFVPGHVYRCDTDPGGPWFIGPFDPATGVDTPGAPNPCSYGACCFDGGSRGGACPCPGNFDDTGASMGLIDLADVPGFVNALLSTGDVCADINGDTFVDGRDIAGMVQLVINMESCTNAGCQVLTETTCNAMGGSFKGVGIACDPDPCGPSGACCDENSFDCNDVTATQCAELYPGRTYLGDGTTCAADCQISAINLHICGLQADCSGITQWCVYQVDEGSGCDPDLQQFATLSIPCTGSCQTGQVTFRWLEYNGVDDCVFTATYVGGTPSCSSSSTGTTFDIVP